MKVVHYLTFVMALVFLLGETARRGIGYFSINATTMIEDYLCGALLLLAAWIWYKGYDIAPKMMSGTWGYATGGMFVPFAAHFEAYLRGVEYRPDHPITDTKSIVMKGVIWIICLVCFIVTLINHKNGQSADSFAKSHQGNSAGLQGSQLSGSRFK